MRQRARSARVLLDLAAICALSAMVLLPVCALLVYPRHESGTWYQRSPSSAASAAPERVSKATLEARQRLASDRPPESASRPDLAAPTLAPRSPRATCQQHRATAARAEVDKGRASQLRPGARREDRDGGNASRRRHNTRRFEALDAEVQSEIAGLGAARRSAAGAELLGMGGGRPPVDFRHRL